MKLKLLRWQLAGFAVTVLGGVLLHFLYNWMQQSILIAPFSSVNESTWEHMKLLFFPMFIFALFQSQFFKEFKNFWCVKLVRNFDRSCIDSYAVLYLQRCNR